MSAYLGDGVYVEWDQVGLVLTATDGHRVTDRIVLEPLTYAALTRYVEALRERVAETAPRKAQAR